MQHTSPIKLCKCFMLHVKPLCSMLNLHFGQGMLVKLVESAELKYCCGTCRACASLRDKALKFRITHRYVLVTVASDSHAGQVSLDRGWPRKRIVRYWRPKWSLVWTVDWWRHFPTKWNNGALHTARTSRNLLSSPFDGLVISLHPLPHSLFRHHTDWCDPSAFRN